MRREGEPLQRGTRTLFASWTYNRCQAMSDWELIMLVSENVEACSAGDWERLNSVLAADVACYGKAFASGNSVTLGPIGAAPPGVCL